MSTAKEAATSVTPSPLTSGKTTICAKFNQIKTTKMLLSSLISVALLLAAVGPGESLAESRLLSLRHLNPATSSEHRWSRELSSIHQESNNLLPTDLFDRNNQGDAQAKSADLTAMTSSAETLLSSTSTTTTISTTTTTTTTTPSPPTLAAASINTASNEVSDNQLPIVAPSTDSSGGGGSSSRLQQTLAAQSNLHQDLDNNINAPQLPSTSSSHHIHMSSKAKGSRHHEQLANHQHNNQQQQDHTSNNTIAQHSSKKGTSGQHGQNLNKLLKYLNERQQELVKRNPGSLIAVARALKMAIVECQYQMRHEPWDCPIYGFGVKPVDIFGKLMTRSFKETSFVRSLLSAAIVHSVSRACTESMITTCGRMRTRDGGYGEDIDFGRRFAREFMAATLELPYGSSGFNGPTSGGSMTIAGLARSLNTNNFATGSGDDVTSQQQQQNNLAANSVMEPTRREKNIRNLINAHNDEVGQLVRRAGHLKISTDSPPSVLSAASAAVAAAAAARHRHPKVEHVLNGMRRECKCHGLSATTTTTTTTKLKRNTTSNRESSPIHMHRLRLLGACNTQTCWLRLPSFREVASKLHGSLHDSIRVIYVAHTPANRPKSLTPGSVRKSNKKRSSSTTISSSSSSARQTPNIHTRSSTLMTTSHQQYYNPYESSNSLTSGTVNIVGSRRRGAKRHTTEPDNCEDCYRAPVAGALTSASSKGPMPAAASTATAANILAEERMSNDEQTMLSSTPIPGDMISDPINSNQATLSMGRNSSSPQRRPIARSIGITASTISPSKTDLLYYEDSPDFCIPSESYNIRGTKGRMCSVNPDEINNCEKLCCGRGYRTEVREEKYKCECQFQFCCKLNCNTCTRRKVLHKCI